MADGAPWWPSLDRALLRAWAKPDTLTALLAGTMHLMFALRAHGLGERAAELLPVLLEFGLVWATFSLRRDALAALRPPLVIAIRLCILLLIPLTVDVVSYTHENSGGGGGDGGGAGVLAPLAAAVAHFKAAVLLLMPVCWLHACLGTSVGLQLAPLQHLVVNTASMALLLRRAPSACRRYVALQPANRTVSNAFYRLLHEATAVLVLGSRRHLDSAAEASCDCQRCVAVVWALQVSAGLVLPTLLVWRAQWHAACDWASQQQAREQPWQRRRAAGGAPLAANRQTTVAEMELAASQYATVAAPALQAADAFPGGWATAAIAAGLGAWVAAVLWRARWAAPCSA